MSECEYSETIDAKIAAIIVLYFPDELLLTRLLNSIQGSVSDIVIVDNTPIENKTWVSDAWFRSKNFSVIYSPLGDNCGIAKAQNVGIMRAIDNLCDHIILFDQDSAAPPGMIENLFSEEQALLADGFNVGAVGPVFVDEKTGEYAKVMKWGNFFSKRISIKNFDLRPVRTDFLIASGSLIRIKVLNKIGLMREDLFIDGVDVEWVLRASYFGYVHFVIPKAVMLHNLGDSYAVFGKKKLILHSDVRHYYAIRNLTNLILNPMMGRKFRTNIFFRIPLYIAFYTYTSKSRFASFKLLLRACIDGYSGRLGKAF